MSIAESFSYHSLVDRVLDSVNGSFWRGKTILVTGASGLIGSAIVDVLLRANDQLACDACVVAAGRNLEKLCKRFGHNPALRLLQYEACEPFCPNGKIDVIIHAASVASPDLYVEKPVETLLANVVGLNGILVYARDQKVGKVIYVSSSEVYGKAEPRVGGYREDDCGLIDILSVRSSYSQGKRAAETLAVSYVKQFGVNVSMVRPGHIYGPTATRADKRVSSAFPYLAADGAPIVMKSAGTQVRSYTHCLDCATAILKVAECGVAGEAYNVANPKVRCSIHQMAEIVAAAGAVPLREETPGAGELRAFNPMDNSCLNAEKLCSIGWRGMFSALEGFTTTVEILKGKSHGRI